MKPPVVCHLRPTNFLGGPEKQILEQCRALDPERWRAVIGTFREGRSRIDLIARAEEGGIPTFLIDTRTGFSPSAIGQLRRHLVRFGVDVLATHGYKADIVGYWATRGTSIPLLVCTRGFTGENLRVRAYEWVDKRFLHRADHVLAVSDGTRRVVEREGVPSRRISVVHNGVRVPGRPVPPAELRAELGLPEEARIVLSVGRLSREKGHRYLVEATPSVIAARPDVHVVLVGDGRERPALERRIQELNLVSRIHFAGFRTDPLQCIRAATLVANPSLTEGSPNIVLETLSLGKPIVATDVGGVSEILTHGVTGWLVPPSDPLALARGIEFILDHPALADTIGNQGLETVKREFSFETQTRRIMDVYDRVLGNAPARDGA